MNEEENVHLLSTEINERLKNKHDFSILFIDDGSTDNTLNVLKEISLLYNNVNFISLSRNFGHQVALKAGYDYADGDAVICMDADFQHPIHLLDEMIEKWEQGYDIIYTKRNDATSAFFKRKTSSLFYKLNNIFSKVKLQDGAADFRLLDSKVLNAFRNMNETDLFIRGIISWMGFKQFEIVYQVDKRRFGKTKYSLRKMLSFSIQGLTSFSISPLRISSLFGLLLSFLSLLYAFYAILVHFLTDETVAGWTSIMVCFLFVSGLQFIMIGIVGEYLGKVFIEVKKRPNYLISEHNISDKEL